MALISCYECQQQISTEATACPHCGAPGEGARPKRKRSSAGRIFVLPVVLTVGGSSAPRDPMRFARLGALALLALALLATPVVAETLQAGKVYRVGVFHVGLDHVPPSLDTLREALRTLGYEEGRNLRLDWRNLPDEEAANATAREFTRDRVDLIVAFENQTTRAAKAATAEIPIVFLHVTDPVAEGFVKTLARPGGNLTGFVYYAVSPAKRLEQLKEMVPKLPVCSS
jgi:ABC-type uncharacterized transport system substrate-binding protein